MAHIDIQISSSHSYLQPDEEGPDLFVHWSNLQCQDDVYKTLNDDEVVEFDMDSTETASGEKYVHVAKIAGTRRGLMAPSDLIFETSLSMKSKQFSSEWIIHAQEKPRMMRCIWTQDAYTLSHKLNVFFWFFFLLSPKATRNGKHLPLPDQMERSFRALRDTRTITTDTKCVAIIILVSVFYCID